MAVKWQDVEDGRWIPEKCVNAVFGWRFFGGDSSDIGGLARYVHPFPRGYGPQRQRWRARAASTAPPRRCGLTTTLCKNVLNGTHPLRDKYP